MDSQRVAAGLPSTSPEAEAAGLYVHVPFCEKLCFYCDFNTYLLRDGGVEEYLDALEQEIRLYREGDSAVSQRTFSTVFIGGGTPTALTAPQLERLLRMLSDGFSVAPDAEITIEANPGTLIDSRLRALREGGVNRLSIGVQSVNDDLLRELGRIHNARQARDCYERARRIGFDNISIDLMFGLPEQTGEDWRRTLTTVAAWEPEHLSCYGLIVEEATPFGERHAAGRLPLPDEEEELAMYRFTMDHLADRGYGHYEISNWAKPGRQSEHNRIYWANGDWLGLGPGAYSQWDGRRFANVRLPGEYSRRLQEGRLPVEESSVENVSRQIAMEDRIIFGLRLREGINAQTFGQIFGVELEDEFGEEIRYFVGGGLLEWHVTGEENRWLRLTEAGLFVSNQIFQRFLR